DGRGRGGDGDAPGAGHAAGGLPLGVLPRAAVGHHRPRGGADGAEVRHPRAAAAVERDHRPGRVRGRDLRLRPEALIVPAPGANREAGAARFAPWAASPWAAVALIGGVTLLRAAYLAWWCPYTLIEDEAH